MRSRSTIPFEPDLSLIRNAITFSGTPREGVPRPAAAGANTSEVLASFGYDEAKVKGLRERKVV